MWSCVQHPKYNLLSRINGDWVAVCKCCYYLHVLLHNTLNGNGQSQDNPPELMEFLWKCKNKLISTPVPPFHLEFWNEKLGLNYFWINEISASTRDAHKLHASAVPHIDLTSLLPTWVSNLYKPSFQKLSTTMCLVEDNIACIKLQISWRYLRYQSKKIILGADFHTETSFQGEVT